MQKVHERSLRTPFRPSAARRRRARAYLFPTEGAGRRLRYRARRPWVVLRRIVVCGNGRTFRKFRRFFCAGAVPATRGSVMERERDRNHRLDVGRHESRNDAAERCSHDHDLCRHRRYRSVQKRKHRLAIRARRRLYGGVVRLRSPRGAGADRVDPGHIARQQHGFGKRLFFASRGSEIPR